MSSFKRDHILFYIDAETITITKNENIYKLTKPNSIVFALMKSMKYDETVTFTTQTKRCRETEENSLTMLFEFIDGIQQNMTITFDYIGRTENGKRIDKMHKIRENIHDLEIKLKKAKHEKRVLECEFAGITNHRQVL